MFRRQKKPKKSQPLGLEREKVDIHKDCDSKRKCNNYMTGESKFDWRQPNQAAEEQENKHREKKWKTFASLLTLQSGQLYPPQMCGRTPHHLQTTWNNFHSRVAHVR